MLSYIFNDFFEFCYGFSFVFSGFPRVFEPLMLEMQVSGAWRRQKPAFQAPEGAIFYCFSMHPLIKMVLDLCFPSSRYTLKMHHLNQLKIVQEGALWWLVFCCMNIFSWDLLGSLNDWQILNPEFSIYLGTPKFRIQESKSWILNFQFILGLQNSGSRKVNPESWIFNLFGQFSIRKIFS